MSVEPKVLLDVPPWVDRFLGDGGAVMEDSIVDTDEAAFFDHLHRDDFLHAAADDDYIHDMDDAFFFASLHASDFLPSDTVNDHLGFGADGIPFGVATGVQSSS